MNFKDYQKKAIGTAVYPKKYKVIYPALGLGDESGKFWEK
jgi:hypothetical protein